MVKGWMHAGSRKGVQALLSPWAERRGPCKGDERLRQRERGQESEAVWWFGMGVWRHRAGSCEASFITPARSAKAL